MEELKVIDEKGLKDVRVFRLCECDAVAAYTLDEAIEWYKEQTGLADDELYPREEIKILSPDYKVYKDAYNSEEMITLSELVDQEWRGEPFIACSTEW